MKKFFASIAALMLAASATVASAQAVLNDNSNPIRYGIQLGFNMPTFGESEFSSTIGYNFGATVLYDAQDFIPNSYLRGSILYNRKGTAADLANVVLDNKNYGFSGLTSYLHYLEIPLHFGWAYEFNDDASLLLETGPYFGFRMWGSIRTDQTTINGQVSQPTNGSMGDYYKDLRRFDAGWGVRAGVMLQKKYEITVGYDWGLCDVVPDIAGSNLNLSINATVYFD